MNVKYREFHVYQRGEEIVTSRSEVSDATVDGLAPRRPPCADVSALREINPI